MRPLKFRAWDRREKKWLWPYPYGFNIIGEVTVFNVLQQIAFDRVNDLEIVQYTGFKDSTTWEQLTEDERTKFVRDGGMPSEWEGKDIYEMDIVKVAKKVEDSEGYYSHTAKFSACVEFEQGSFMVGFLKLFEPDIYDSHPECLKIIGNKFENPELLK